MKGHRLGLTATALLAGCLALSAVCLRLTIWHYDLGVPFVYSGDALYVTVLAKALTEGGWNYHIARLGAPFGMDAVDFPIGCTLDFAAMKALSLVIHNPFLVVNLYWLLAIAMAGSFAALFLRTLNISSLGSIVTGALYGIIPFTFYRNIGHLCLVHFIVPVAAYLATSLARPNTSRGSLAHENPIARKKGRRPLLSSLALCVAVGLSYIYWAFFACIVISIGTLIGYYRTRKKAILLTALLFLVTILVSSLADISGSLLYWQKHGRGTALGYKQVADADIFGLKIRQLLTPIAHHPLAAVRGVRDRIISAGFPNDDNESVTSYLGLIGASGFVFLVFICIARPRGRILADSRLRMLSGMVVALVLIAEVGGFGSVFNVFILHEFRCYNRVSPFISLFSLGGIAVVADQVLGRPAVLSRCLFFALLFLFGVFDQVDVGFLSNRSVEERRFYQDRKYIQDLEARLPAAAIIFQLPHTGFPPDGVHLRMGPYDNSRAYLHSRTLRWSWGAIDGRHYDWARNTSELPLPQMLERLALTGFDGVLIDRFGYPDSVLEQRISDQVGASATVGGEDRWSFLSLATLRAKILQNLSAEERAKREDAALHPVGIAWLGGFSVEEQSQTGRWRWCGRQGIIRFVNESNTDQQITIEATLQQYSGEPGSLIIERETVKQAVSLSALPVAYHDRFSVRAHSVTSIHFDFTGPLLHVPLDSRELAFQIRDFRCVPEQANQKADP